MAERSLIAWTHNTFNPWMGCVKVSDGCKNCYAETLVTNRMGKKLWGPASTTNRERTSAANWNKVRTWNRQAERAGVSMRVFCASLADVFEDHPQLDTMRSDLFTLWRETPYLQWQVLTKRPEGLAELLPDDWGDYGYPNVWLGTSIESMKVAARADALREIPAAVRFISYEPALGPLDGLDLSGIDWMIFGGESGPGYRAMNVQWARDIRARCATPRGLHGHTTAFFFKQSAAPRTEMGTKLDGETVREYPIPRSVTKYDLFQTPAAVVKAQGNRIRLDNTGRPAAPFFDDVDPRVVAREALPLFNGAGQ